jgi:16S rRNA (guanine(966)-N(2))-methyltransferase RsmD
MVLRIATGKFKGTVLVSSDTAKELRPTQALVREAIINTLRSMFASEDLDFADLDILDLYSGTGSMGFEFLSNEVQSLTFVERDPKCLKLLKANANKLGLNDQVSIQSGQLPNILRVLGKKSKTYDLIFFDPPFKFSVKEFMAVAKAVLDNKLVKPGGLMVLEYKNQELAKALADELSSELEIINLKKYGGCVVVFAKVFLKKSQKISL